jgi:hypothetical protein
VRDHASNPKGAANDLAYQNWLDARNFPFQVYATRRAIIDGTFHLLALGPSLWLATLKRAHEQARDAVRPRGR